MMSGVWSRSTQNSHTGSHRFARSRPSSPATRCALLAAGMLLISCQPPAIEREPAEGHDATPRKSMGAQQAASNMIESLGGNVVYHFESFDGANVPAQRYGQDFVENMFENPDPELRPRIIYAELHGHQFTDGELLLLRHLPDLKRISLRSSRVTDLGLVVLEELRALRTLSLREAHVTGGGLVHVAKLPLLESMLIDSPLLEDEDLRHLGSAASLQHLTVMGSRITDEGVEYFAEIPKLTDLSIGGTSISGAGLGPLRKCRHLSRLSLGEHQLTREGIEQLKLLKNIKTLSTMTGYLSSELEAELRQARPDLELSSSDFST